MVVDKAKDTPPVRKEISAGFVVYRRTEEGIKFLVLYHGHNYWNFPKGKLESEEKSMAAAIRETKEEAGLSARDLRIVQNFKAYERFRFRRAGEPVFKVVIFYLAETRMRDIRISSEHEGFGWFSYSEARRILGRYRDSQRVLRQAYDFIRGTRTKSSSENSPRPDAHVPRSSAPRR